MSYKSSRLNILTLMGPLKETEAPPVDFDVLIFNRFSIIASLAATDTERTL